MKGKTVIITGRLEGIGYKAVEEFAKAGNNVIVWNTEEVESLSIVAYFKTLNLHFDYQNVDCTLYTQVEEAAKSVIQKYKSIDILINNTNTEKEGSLFDLTAEQWQRVIDINLTGVFNCTKAIAPYMVKNNYGRIINAASMASIYENMSQTNYDATKSGLVGITRVWARELTKHNVTVNAVYSGFVEPEPSNSIPEDMLSSLIKKIPAGRLGKTEEIVKSYLFLASEDASYISGTILNVDGGYFA